MSFARWVLDWKIRGFERRIRTLHARQKTARARLEEIRGAHKRHRVAEDRFARDSAHWERRLRALTVEIADLSEKEREARERLREPGGV